MTHAPALRDRVLDSKFGRRSVSSPVLVRASSSRVRSWLRGAMAFPQQDRPLIVHSGQSRSVRRLARGRDHAADEKEFATLFLSHYVSLCEFVDSYIHAPDVAEEIVQSVFLRVWESRASWDPQRGARAYLFGACRNQALDHLRHEQIVTQTAATAHDDVLSSIPARADARLEAAELGDRLRAVVARLPERRRLVVVLRWQYQLTNPEIARILGISVKGVEISFSRALADLRRELGDGAGTLDLV